MIGKIIAFGLIINGPESYLRSSANMIDGAVVFISVLSFALSGSKLKIVKILRMLKVLRPLRVISRNKGLKIGIQALLMAIPSILNVIIVTLLFFLIFGILGITYFKGTFYNCHSGEVLPENILSDFSSLIVTKWDCLNYGGAWLNND